MEVAKKHECQGPDSAQLHLAVSDDAMFVHPPVLVVLRIVCESSENL